MRKLTQLELRHLRYIIAVAEHGSIRKASRALGIRQSAISRRIADLEDTIGVALFIRSHSGISLTYAGQRFLFRVRGALHQIDQAVREADTVGRGESGTVRIGIISSLASGFMVDLFLTYSIDYPGVSLEFVEDAPARHVQAVQQHQIDIAFVIDHPPTIECDVAPLWSERVFVVLSHRHKLAKQERITWADLSDQLFVVTETPSGSVIHDYILRHIPELGRPPAIKRHAVNRDTLLQTVAMSDAVTLTSEATTGMTVSGIVYRPLMTNTLMFYAVWSSSNDNPALRRLLSLARTLSRDLRPTPPDTTRLITLPCQPDHPAWPGASS